MSPCDSENCSYVFCQTCIEQWNKKSCLVCRTACREWKHSALAEHLIWQLHLHCPFEYGWKGWKGTYGDCHTSHYLKCPSVRDISIRIMELFLWFLSFEYCHYHITSTLLATHITHECALAPSICNACSSSFLMGHVERECLKNYGSREYIERGLFAKHELETRNEHFYLVKQAITARLENMTCLIHSSYLKETRFAE
eukprot:jgi/Galph1/4372/GphlegSOOS_G3126.1